MEITICEEVKSIFTHGVVPEHLNDTLVTLIPKCQSLESLKNYRPISLCNSVYKIVSKIIVESIRPHISKLVSPVQTTFVPRRKGINNVLIAQEPFYALDKEKGKEGYMIIKIDLEKACDRIEWCFIHKMLQAYHFPQNIIKVIMSCVTTTRVSILFSWGMRGGGCIGVFYTFKRVETRRSHISVFVYFLHEVSWVFN